MKIKMTQEQYIHLKMMTLLYRKYPHLYQASVWRSLKATPEATVLYSIHRGDLSYGNEEMLFVILPEWVTYY